MPDIRFRLIDESIRADHSHLSEDDQCYFLYEYTSRKSYDFSETNQLVSNLKKKPSLKGGFQYRYKDRAIDQCANQMRAALNPGWLRQATLVPVPPSKVRGHIDYDDRIERVCRRIGAGSVRVLVTQNASMQSAHESNSRPTITDLVANYTIDESLVEPVPAFIGIVDDVLTAGTHFKAVQRVLARRFPDVRIYGFFIARRIFPDDYTTNVFAPIEDG